MSIRFFLTATLCALLGLPATNVSAQSTLGEVVQLDILDGGTTRNGTVMGALRLTIADGWKTYWRAPGEAGIPPQINWGGSRNVGDLRVIWPTPVVFELNGYQSIGYKHQLVLPIEITPADPGKPVHLKGAMEFGVCSDICVPGYYEFDHQLDAQAGRNPAIAAAMAQRPFSASEAGVSAAKCSVAPTKDGLSVQARIAMPSAGGREVAVIESGDPDIIATQTRTERSGDTLLASSVLSHVSDSAFALDRSQLRITVIGKNHAVDIRGCTSG